MSMFNSTTSSKSDSGIVLITLMIFILIPLLYSLRYLPPQPKPISIPESEFSAGRAETILYSLVGDGIPHPTGSEQNKLVRQRISNFLEEYGYQVELQHDLLFSNAPKQADQNTSDMIEVSVTNILTKLKGTGEGKAIMLTAHYDSVSKGPGAADNGVGVATVLEIARMLKQQSKPKNDIIFLFTDAEEVPGLLGANLFVSKHPWVEKVGVVINLDARGTSGPSIMFETSGNSRWLMDIFARNIKKPFTSSLAVEVYKRLPNDTDFTPFKRAHMQGYNFAFIGDVKNYHTQNDNFNVVDRGSMQHQGENVYSLVQAIQNVNIPKSTQPQINTVYFDVFAWKVIWWPDAWSIVISITCLILLILNHILMIIRFPQMEIIFWKSILSIPIIMSSTLLVFSILWLCNFGLTASGTFDRNWIDHPVICSLIFWSLSISATAMISSQITKYYDGYLIWLGVWVVWSVLAAMCSYYLIGASYLFIVPIVIASIGSLVIVVFSKHFIEFKIKWLILLSVGAAALIWLPLEQSLYDAVGFSMNILLIIRVAFLSSILIPVFVSSGKKVSTHTSQFCFGLSMGCAAWVIMT